LRSFRRGPLQTELRLHGEATKVIELTLLKEGETGTTVHDCSWFVVREHEEITLKLVRVSSSEPRRSMKPFSLLETLTDEEGKNGSVYTFCSTAVVVGILYPSELLVSNFVGFT